ncbi:unnamed protein product [Dovyalis caffra]|uniref:Fucosyltransferase n=1 Tax=Dovyalis caffra TaxID=77055 RepID=A0AAV1RAR8_9ROSI|nr:unnamed protein product [Dovyalis caffra]
MEEENNLRGNIPLPDQKKKNCELTGTNSDSSGLTVDNANARPQGPSAVWTDEKHRLYLDSLEASFVNNQLRHSFRLRGWSRGMGGRSCSSRRQFMVLRDGSRQKKRNEPLLESTADSHCIKESTPSICHFISAGNQRNAAHHDLQRHNASCGGGIHVRENATVSGALSRSSEQQPVCYQNSIGSTTEVSDQNFDEGDQGEKSCCVHKAKRLRTSGAEASSTDQVVPFTKSDTRDVSSASQASSEREEQMHQELLGSRATTPSQEGLPVSDGSQSNSTRVSVFKMKWSNFLPIFVALVVIAEIAFLGRLDMAKNAALVDSWADSFLYKSSVDSGLETVRTLESDSCEEWLEKEDSVVYSRDFDKDPVLVAGGEKMNFECDDIVKYVPSILVLAYEWNTCGVGCEFGFNPSKNPDAGFGSPQQGGAAGVLRSMEAASYYTENNIAHARRRGYNVVMTTSLSSDVPVGYFSWAEYDIMAPVQPKTEKALAAAFISNCGARNFRLQALDGLERSNIKIDSYGNCHRNHDGRVDKVETLKRYKFSLAFENSNEEDYVTEKFFQSLVAGTIPVVVGAPNIQDFAPAPNSILHIKELEDVDSIAKTMKYLAENPDAYNQSLRWKYEGPSDSFKALVDMAAVHSSCRLCIHLATMIREKEENSPGFKRRPCRCTRGSETVYHLYVRERGRFEMASVFLRSGNLTINALETEVLKKFKSLKHVPIWRQERPESIRGDDFKVYKVYPVGMTQRQALYAFKFNTDDDFKNHLEVNSCAKFEVKVMEVGKLSDTAKHGSVIDAW